MGCWGYSPKECDGPADIFQEALTKPVNKLLAKYFGPRIKYSDSHERWEALGVFQLIIDADLPIERESYVKRAIELAYECMNDEEFVQDFRDPKQMKKATDEFISELYEMVEMR